MKPSLSAVRIFYLGLSLLLTLTSATAQQKRPAITGISHMCVYASDAAAADNFYGRILGGTKGIDPQNSTGTRYYFSPTQFVEVLPLPVQHDISRMACVAYNTTDVGGLLTYLRNKGVNGLSELRTNADGSRWFETKDPEGNPVQFIEPGKATDVTNAKPIGKRVIHVGYLVHDRAAEDRFYRDILGFRPYWYGGMEPAHTDWVSQQASCAFGAPRCMKI